MSETDESDTPTRRRPVQREHELQKAVRTFVRDAIDLPPSDFQFLAHDSAQKATDNQRSRLIARGVLPGEADTLLCVKGLPPVWIELKHGNAKPSPDQLSFLEKMQNMGHRAAIARTVLNYWAILSSASVPLRRNAEIIAADLDLKVHARIARAEQRVATPYKARSGKATPRYTANARMARKIYAR